jgi:2-polyprenyl-3-methyl-5-hydroxy-6-metoxy-1,4-benzoquinol methylase
VKQCPNCFSHDVLHVYESSGVPTYQNVLLESSQEATNVPRGTIELVFCNECTFLYNAAFDENLVGYGASYENDQTYSAIFMEHVAHVAKNIINKNHITHHKILEIGCGTGYFLNKIVLEDNENIGVGFDKSLPSTSITNKISLYNKYYEDSDLGDFDVVLSRHVVEHILNNNILFARLIKKNPNAKFFIETPSLEWIVKNNIFFDIFYEHCSYFCGYSIAKLLSNHGLSIVNAEHVFNGQYMWVEAVATDKPLQPAISKALDAIKIKNFF